MELEYLHTKPGDVVIPPYDKNDPDDVAVLVYSEGEYICIGLDDLEYDRVDIHKSQVDDLIVALKTMKENNA